MEILQSVFVLIACCSLFGLITYLIHILSCQDWRFAILGTFVVLGLLAWFFSESLSVFHAITFTGLAIMWGLVGLIGLTTAVKISKQSINNILCRWKAIRRHISSLPVDILFPLSYILLSTLLLSVIAFIAPPNTWDSMTYHMSRVMHWQQNHSLSFYATGIARQLYLSPMAEVLILNLQILTGSDRLANFVQLFSMIGCLVGTSLIAKLLGGNRYVQIFSSLATITIPMGILQSTSTQNDYVTGLWIICFTVFLLMQICGSVSLVGNIFAGLSLGLAINTKLTAILYLTPIGVWFAIVLLQRLKLRSIKCLVLVLGTAVIIITPHFLRNYGLYSNPLGPMSESNQRQFTFTNDTYSMSVLVSNAFRNLAINLASPSETLNTFIEKQLLGLHALIGLNINDSKTTWGNTQFQIEFRKHEDLAGNPLHLLLILISTPLIFFVKNAKQIIYFVCILTGFMLFSVLIKWTPWNSRYELPLFIMTMPLIALILYTFLHRSVTNLAMLVLCIASIPYLFMNESRPVMGPYSIFIKDRVFQYFTSSPSQFVAYDKTTEAINSLACNQVGLVTGGDDWEYPIWVMTKARDKIIHFEHILVNNVSQKLEARFIPCAVVTTYAYENQKIIYENRSYIKYLDEGQLDVFVLSDASK